MSEYFDCITQEKIALKNLQMLNTVINVVRGCITVRANRGKKYPSNCKKLLNTEKLNKRLGFQSSKKEVTLNAQDAPAVASTTTADKIADSAPLLESTVTVDDNASDKLLPTDNNIENIEPHDAPNLKAPQSPNKVDSTPNLLATPLLSDEKLKKENHPAPSLLTLPSIKKPATLPIPPNYMLHPTAVKALCNNYNQPTKDGKDNCKKGENCTFLHLCENCWGSHPPHKCPVADEVNSEKNIVKFKKIMNKHPDFDEKFACKICLWAGKNYTKFAVHMCSSRHITNVNTLSEKAIIFKDEIKNTNPISELIPIATPPLTEKSDVLQDVPKNENEKDENLNIQKSTVLPVSNSVQMASENENSPAKELNIAAKPFVSSSLKKNENENSSAKELNIAAKLFVPSSVTKDEQPVATQSVITNPKIVECKPSSAAAASCSPTNINKVNPTAVPSNAGPSMLYNAAQFNSSPRANFHPSPSLASGYSSYPVNQGLNSYASPSNAPAYGAYPVNQRLNHFASPNNAPAYVAYPVNQRLNPFASPNNAPAYGTYPVNQRLNSFASPSNTFAYDTYNASQYNTSQTGNLYAAQNTGYQYNTAYPSQEANRGYPVTNYSQNQFNNNLNNQHTISQNNNYNPNAAAPPYFANYKRRT